MAKSPAVPWSLYSESSCGHPPVNDLPPRHQAVLELTPQLVIERASPAASLLLGLPCDALVGKRIGEFFVHEPLIDVHLLFRNQPEAVQAFPARLVATEKFPERHAALTLIPLAETTGAPPSRLLLVICLVEPGIPPLPNLGGVAMAPTEFVTHLTRGFAHKFNNILTIFNGYTELLGMEPNPSQMVSDSISQFEMAGEQARQLIQYLLRLGGLLGVDFEPVSAGDLFSRCREAVQTACPEGLRLVIERTDGEPVFETDAARAAEIIAELARNAQEAGATTLKISLQPTADDNHAELQIVDDGQGIPFTPPERALLPGVTSQHSDSRHGVGLACAVGIARSLRGELRLVESRKGWTEFRLLLPKQLGGL